ncbi:hypothetical protein GLW08_04060 [Pontibacillus yanchengensis]|uniref:Uncharacterized protein n=2 Tax=Pontibacillus yanchengensis TaxID=462910 RepID=A0ACC7VEF1_9BACI|nr:hypothetical protein [Pontibacillus yanchengensis]MYL35123.1 hypothetical protein [Pontibacillus yanchengensis]MYL52510.1 hypothetical protein [Pontibacillus yanchengensis]
MRTFVIAGVTIIIETILLWLFSLWLGVHLLEILLLGGISIFGIAWFFQQGSTYANNHINTMTRGWTGLDTGGVRVFRFKVGPVVFGLLMFILISLIITVIYYVEI